MDTKEQRYTAVAKTILSQIGNLTLMCIGAHAFQVLDEKLGGVGFCINPNPKLQEGGSVSVVLDYSDTYDVKIFTPRGEIVYEAEDIYCDMLGGQEGVIEQITG